MKALDYNYKGKWLVLQRISMYDERSVKMMFHSKYSRALFLVAAMSIAAINAAGQSGGTGAPLGKWSYHADDGQNLLDYTIVQRADGFEVTGQFKVGWNSAFVGVLNSKDSCTIDGSYLKVGRRLRATAHCPGGVKLLITGSRRSEEDAFELVVAYESPSGRKDISSSVSLVARRPGAKPPPPKGNSDENARNLSGKWMCNDGGTYIITQSGAGITWEATSGDGGITFKHTFKGSIEGDLITGHFTDDPTEGSVHQQGDLEFNIISDNHLTLKKHSVPFNCTNMTKEQ